MMPFDESCRQLNMAMVVAEQGMCSTSTNVAAVPNKKRINAPSIEF
jgi:hypothetical protein